jgi:DNA polymerase-3 subunit delta'
VPDPVLRHHREALERPMAQWSAQKRVPPVLLLTGQAGIGKRHLAYWLAQWLLCERAGFATPAEESLGGGLFGASEPVAPAAPTLSPCGECAACQRALNGNWVDFTEISAEAGDGETGTLKIDQFRQLKATMGFGAFDGAYRITLIRDADRMTVQAANSLLKVLEEPPPGWVFFLTASDPTLLLPTMVSRCQTVRLRPLSEETVKQLLGVSEVPRERQAICAALAQGSWSKGLALAQDEAWEHRTAIFRFLEQPGAELDTLVNWATAEPRNFDLLLDQLEQVTQDLVSWSVREESGQGAAMTWANLDGKPSLVRHAQGALKRTGSLASAREFWTERAERLFRARQEALAPLSRKILVQDLLLPWMAV